MTEIQQNSHSIMIRHYLHSSLLVNASFKLYLLVEFESRQDFLNLQDPSEYSSQSVF